MSMSILEKQFRQNCHHRQWNYWDVGIIGIIGVRAWIRFCRSRPKSINGHTTGFPEVPGKVSEVPKNVSSKDNNNAESVSNNDLI
ncbi:MAG: hypothetical protein JW725_03065, partial [Candidatus Babeliaceae bacterium]|nr:hypothetical protein [Candidatus Babeliaceae bacterium]